VPPQNPVAGAIVDVSALGVKLAHPMLQLLYALLATVRSSLKPQREVALSRLWPDWHNALIIVKPQTVIG